MYTHSPYTQLRPGSQEDGGKCQGPPQEAAERKLGHSIKLSPEVGEIKSMGIVCAKGGAEEWGGLGKNGGTRKSDGSVMGVIPQAEQPHSPEVHADLLPCILL